MEAKRRKYDDYDERKMFLEKNLKFPVVTHTNHGILNETRIVFGDYHRWYVLPQDNYIIYEHWFGENDGVGLEIKPDLKK